MTANLADANGAAYGAQWTLFRQAIAAGGRSARAGPTSRSGWAMPRSPAPTPIAIAETFARGGVGQAGVEASPFRAWIDAWEMRGLDAMNADNIAPLELNASGADFSYALRLDADRPLVLQGDGGYSRKSLREQASYYYSQPHFHGEGQPHHRRQAGRRHRAGLARSRVEQPAAGVRPDRMGLALAASATPAKS